MALITVRDENDVVIFFESINNTSLMSRSPQKCVAPSFSFPPPGFSSSPLGTSHTYSEYLPSGGHREREIIDAAGEEVDRLKLEVQMSDRRKEARLDC